MALLPVMKDGLPLMIGDPPLPAFAEDPCDCCGGVPCSACIGGSMSGTVTVTLSGFSSYPYSGLNGSWVMPPLDQFCAACLRAVNELTCPQGNSSALYSITYQATGSGHQVRAGLLIFPSPPLFGFEPEGQWTFIKNESPPYACAGTIALDTVFTPRTYGDCLGGTSIKNNFYDCNGNVTSPGSPSCEVTI